MIFTVRSSESSTDGGHWWAPTHDELIILALVVCRLRLAEHHVLHVQSGGGKQIIQRNKENDFYNDVIIMEIYVEILYENFNFSQKLFDHGRLSLPDYCLQIPDLTNICGAFVDG